MPSLPHMAFCTGRRWNMYIFILWIIFLHPNLLMKAHGNETDRRCRHFSTTESFEVGNTKGRLLEVHLRQNVRGEVEIIEGEPSSDSIRIDVDKSGPTIPSLDYIVAHYALYDVGEGMVYVVQVDYIEPSSGLITIVAGAVFGTILLLAFLFIGLWFFIRRKNGAIGGTPHTDHRGSEASGASAQPSFLSVNSALTETPGERGPTTSATDLDVQGAAEGQTTLSRGSSGKCLPPPPPRRAENLYSPNKVNNEDRRLGGGGVGSPKGLSRPTLVSMSIICAISLVYAACPYEPHAKVLIYLPPIIQLEAVKLFFSHEHKIQVITDRWLHKNNTQLNIFDIDDASYTNNKPCSAQQKCSNAYIQNLAGCDAGTSECICQRGYSLENGLCTDIDECQTGQHGCPSTATCQNEVGAYRCQCGYGYYGDRGTCLACSVGCPSGEYEQKACSNYGDRSCQDCTPCSGSMYEARPCQGNQDRRCMHVAHPLLITGQEGEPTFLEAVLSQKKPRHKKRKRLKVEKSENVFVENLHATRNLETTYYVTDAAQASDFFWVRESGLQVHIGIIDAHLIAKYEDETHNSDNKYMVDNPNTSEDKAKFRSVVKKYCRHPIPDYYSITLEISRDRITTAQSVVCDSSDPKRPSCPSQYSNGDTYLHRSLNEACQKMGTFPDPLMPAANSIVCTKNTALLRDIFNQTYAPERPINFPPRRCRNALTRCKQCLNQLRCAMIDIFDQQCCQIDCYTLRDCKLSTSSHCTGTPTECAMGDAYRYTIQPVYQNLKKDFQCHIKHKKPNALYTMFFHIKVPGPYGPESELDTPRVYKTIYAHDFDFQSQGSFDADYISVEHSTGLDLQDEFIIKGREYTSLTGDARWNYTVHPMRPPDQFSQRKVVVHEISHNIFVASTQFESPFAYSTSSWVKGNECDKDIGKFKYVQPHHTAEGQNVNVMIQNVHSPYEYYVKSVDNPPYIRFMVPGNTSVLPWYFRGKGPVLYTNDSLSVVLELQNDGRIWSISLAGEMSFCPGFLAITINDLQDSEELFRYDALIFCPTTFNMSFKVPNRGQKPDRTFEIRLEDAKKSYRIYLYHMIYDSQYIGSQIDVDSLSDDEESPWTIIVLVIMSSGVIIVLLNILYVYFEYTKMKRFYAKKQEHNSLYAHGDVGRVVHHTTVTHTTSSQLSQKQYVFIVSYVVIRIVYSLVFTFTVFDAILGITLREDIWQMSDISHFQMDKYNDSRKYSIEIEKFGQNEMLRQARKVTDMQGACSNYIEELFDQMLDQIDNVTLSQQHSRMYGRDTSLGSLIDDFYRHKTETYLQKVAGYSDQYMAQFSKDIKPTMNAYRKYLERVYNNDWFQFPQLLFNKSDFPSQRELVFQNSNLTGTAVDYAAFLPVEEVEDVQLWPVQWKERFERMRPKAPPLNVPTIDPSNPLCDKTDATESYNLSMSSTPKSHLDSSRFFSNQLPGKSVRGPRVNSKNLKEEYKYMADIEMKPPSEPLFSIDSFVKDLNLTVVRLILLSLDILIFFYRCSRTFMTARTLCQGFDETKTIPADKKFMKDVEKLHEQINTSRTGPSTTDSELSGTQLNLPDYLTSIESHKRMLHPTANSNAAQNGSRHFATNEKADSKKRWTEKNGFCQKLLKLMQNSAIPKFAIGLAILTLFIIVVQLVSIFFSADVFVDINGFRSFLVGLDTQVNQTNWYLREQAKYFNDITIEIYKGQMRSEMLHLQSLVEYFNQEQTRLADNYIAEGCVIRKGIIGNRTCDISVNPAQLDISMVPCNFIPIQPQLYTDLQKLFSPAHLARDFSPILDALRSLILKSGYAILAITAIMLLVHFIGVVLFHFLRTRHKFPVHRTYVTSFPNVIAIETTKSPQEGESEEEEEDDDDNEMKTYQTRVSSSSPEKLKGLLANFKYSETKV